MIDHGASLYFHHGWGGGVTDPERFAAQPWDVRDHVLGAHVDRLAAVDAELGRPLGHDVFAEVLAEVPDEWLEPVPGAEIARRAARGVRRLPDCPARARARGCPVVSAA